MCDTAASYRLNYVWRNVNAIPVIDEHPFTDPPVNSIPNIRPFTDPVGGTGWVQVLRITGAILCDFMETYPAWFTQTPVPGIVTSFQGYEIGATPRTGAVIAASRDYSTGMIVSEGSTPGASAAEQIQYLFDNLGGGGGTDDHLVLNSATDPTPGYLGAKIFAGANITKNTVNAGLSNEGTQITGTGTLGTGTLKVLTARNNATATVVPKDGSWVTAVFDTNVLTTAAVTFAGSVATINTAGTYFIEPFVTLNTGFSRQQHWIRVMVNTGGGYAEVPGSRMPLYTPNDANDLSAMHTKAEVVAVGGELVKVEVYASSGTLDMTIATTGTTLHIYTY